MEEVKIRKIDVENLKAVSSFTALFNGKSAHVTGANGIGKSTVIRAFTDRLRGLKPSIITKIGEKEGKTIMELTDGCRFEWEYNNQGKDSLNYFTPNNLKPVRRDVFKHICGQYFPNQFDINRFLTTTEPAKRLKMISELVNVDLTEIQTKYKDAFEVRKDAKKELKILEAQIKPKPETQTFDDSDFESEQKKVNGLEVQINGKKQEIENERNFLNAQYIKNKAENDLKESEHQKVYQKELDGWLGSEDKREVEIINFNDAQDDLTELKNEAESILSRIAEALVGTNFVGLFDFDTAKKIISNMPQPKELRTFNSTPKPEFESLKLPDPMPSSFNLNEIKEDLTVLENSLILAYESLEFKKSELSDLNASKQLYDLQLKQWNEFRAEIEKQANHVQDCEVDVSKILTEIKAIVSGTKLPDEFSIDLTNKNDILFRPNTGIDYFPITNETLADSAIFIAAFKLQANYLEAFRVAHFDVSYLDYENREKVLKEAINMNIQLITESPAHDADSKMLQYKITEE